MNKSKLIWGIICLALAVLLGILNLVLEPENLMFQIGDANLPWVPAVILGVVGIILLATSGTTGEATAGDSGAPDEAVKPGTVFDPEVSALNKRLETIGWGLFLIMLGGFMFVPQELIPRGLWSIAVGLVMLGLNAARYFNGIKMSGFTTALGIISLVGGTLELIGWSTLEGGILLIILGAYLLLKPRFDKQQLFGKAEESSS